jgi:hypothetical protein
MAKISAGGRSRATSVATRRSVACSSPRRCASALAWAFEMAMATSSVNAAMRGSASSANGRSAVEEANAKPQTRPSTTIGTPTDVRMPRSRASSTNGPVARSSAGPHRHGRPLSRIARRSSFMGWDEPIGKSVWRALQAATSVIASSASRRINDAGSAPTSQPISWLTAAKISSCETPRATSVATRRSAVCSWATRVASPRAGTRTVSSPSAAAAM